MSHLVSQITEFNYRRQEKPGASAEKMGRLSKPKHALMLYPEVKMMMNYRGK
jgi:hypothetical protein